MKSPSRVPLSILLITIALLVTLLVAPGWNAATIVSAQVPAAETTVTEQPTVTSTTPPTATPTSTPVGPTNTPTNTSPNTPTQVVTLPPETPTPPPSGPVPIPEPITVVLFGTGLAALSAALASRRKTEE